MLHDIALMQSPVRLRDMVRDWQAAGAEVALMPVLGPVHGGHLAMIRAARAAGLRVAACPVDVSDSCLPRDPERDAALLERAGADAVVAPDSGLHGAAGRLRLRPCWLTEVLCGRVEQGCFDRAVRVTLRLVERSGADCVLLSDLNWQFCVILARILGDLDLGAVPRILPAPRDAAGLPLSAELAALDPPARRQAERFARVMDDTARVIRLGADPAIACRGARARLADAGIVAVDYLEMRHAATLARVHDPRLEGPARLFGAVRLRGLRLIDSRPLP